MLFFIIFWSFSFGIYTWMDQSFGDDYINRVKQQQSVRGDDSDFDDRQKIIVTLAGTVALSQLKNIIIMLNGVLLIVIPVVSLYLTKKTLAPIDDAHEKQRQFASDASHELRTPLAIMLGEAEIALQKPRTATYYRQHIQSAKEELNRLSTLVNNLLFLAREDGGGHPIVFSPVDITDVLSSVINDVSFQIKKKKQIITFLPPEESVVVEGSSPLLYQLFFNLLENAVKYTPPRGSITVSFKKQHNRVEISVQDTGIGIASNIKDKVFERFYRSDSSRSETKGYGLGLSICRTIVRRHHGSLRLDSIENRGSTFTVSLPLSSLHSSV